MCITGHKGMSCDSCLGPFLTIYNNISAPVHTGIQRSMCSYLMSILSTGCLGYQQLLDRGKFRAKLVFQRWSDTPFIIKTFHLLKLIFKLFIVSSLFLLLLQANSSQWLFRSSGLEQWVSYNCKYPWPHSQTSFPDLIPRAHS